MNQRGQISVEELRGPSSVAFQGRVLTVRVDPVTAKGGPSTREVVERPRAAAVVAEGEDGRLVVVRQFRWAVSTCLDELPAGLIDPGEEPLAAAQRELAEETGYRAQTWQLLFDYYASPGYSTERVSLFSARGLAPGPRNLDPDEDIVVTGWSRQEAERYLAEGRVQNGILLIGVLWWLYGSTPQV